MPHTFKILENKEGSVLVEKSNIKHQFTLEDLKASIAHAERTLRELNGKLKLEEASVENIEHFHPFVKEFSDEQLSTLSLYAEAREYTKQLPPKIAQFEEALAEEQANLETITALIDDQEA